LDENLPTTPSCSADVSDTRNSSTLSAAQLSPEVSSAGDSESRWGSRGVSVSGDRIGITGFGGSLGRVLRSLAEIVFSLGGFWKTS
jgi:hypothetical protein